MLNLLLARIFEPVPSKGPQCILYRFGRALAPQQSLILIQQRSAEPAALVVALIQQPLGTFLLW